MLTPLVNLDTKKVPDTFFPPDKGTLAWRSRVAPLEQRIVVNGCVESTWPAVGSVLVHDGKLFAHAGRGTEADGGIAVVQLDPATGETTWAGMIDGASRAVTMNRDRRPLGKEERAKIGKFRNMQRRIDLLRVANGTVACNQTTIEPGSGITQTQHIKSNTPGGPMLDGYLGRFKVRGFKPAEPRATAGEHTVIATVLADGGNVTLVKNVEKGSSEPIAKLKLDAAPIHDGLAIAEGKVFVSLKDGRLLCLGDKGGPK